MSPAVLASEIVALMVILGIVAALTLLGAWLARRPAPSSTGRTSRFVMSETTPVCPRCFYRLGGWSTPRCPECGTDVVEKGVRTGGIVTRPLVVLALVGLSVAAGALARRAATPLFMRTTSAGHAIFWDWPSRREARDGVMPMTSTILWRCRRWTVPPRIRIDGAIAVNLDDSRKVGTGDWIQTWTDEWSWEVPDDTRLFDGRQSLEFSERSAPTAEAIADALRAAAPYAQPDGRIERIARELAAHVDAIIDLAPTHGLGERRADWPDSLGWEHGNLVPDGTLMVDGITYGIRRVPTWPRDAVAIVVVLLGWWWSWRRVRRGALPGWREVRHGEWARTIEATA